MNQIEIKQKIDSNNKVIESLMTPNIFTLNNTVSQLLRENAELQKSCEHKFEEGYCIYCYQEENHE